jgi:hypothetical protein
MYVPYIKQEEPLKAECQHFVDCIRNGSTPMTSGTQGLELVRILEASSASLKLNGAAVDLRGQALGETSSRSGSALRLAISNPGDRQASQFVQPIGSA